MHGRLRTQQWLQDSFRERAEDDDSQDMPIVHVHVPGKSPAGPHKDTIKPQKHGMSGAPGAGSDSSDGRGSAAASMVSGSQVSGDDASSVVTSSAGGGDEELTADYRCLPAHGIKHVKQDSVLHVSRFTWLQT